MQQELVCQKQNQNAELRRQDTLNFVGVQKYRRDLFKENEIYLEKYLDQGAKT